MTIEAIGSTARGRPMTAERRAAIVADYAATGSIKVTSYNTATPIDAVSWVLHDAGVRARLRRPRRER